MFSKLIQAFQISSASSSSVSPTSSSSRSSKHKEIVVTSNNTATVYNDESGYLALLRKIVEHGSMESNRTGVRTKTMFGGQLSFDLSNNKLPLLTTKYVSFHNIAHELLWFMSGSTNQKDLEHYNVNIWRENSTPQYLDKIGLKKRYAAFEDLGPIYSHQWRHFGAMYIDSKTNYYGQGVDQLQNVLTELRFNPTSRRNILLSWNPIQLDEMVLPPCHVLAQFRVLNENKLHCHVYQRSADFLLGVPYNLASYGLLTHIFAKLSGNEAERLIFSYGDMHVYETHLDAVGTQLARKPLPLPEMYIDIADCYDTYDYLDAQLEQITYQSFRLENYKYHPKITYKMVP